MKRTCLALIILLILLCTGCRNQDPFSTYDIVFSELSSSELRDIISVQSELAYTPEAQSSSDVSLVSFSNNISRGAKAEIIIKGKPNTKYTIRVTYSSGISRSKALNPQVSNENGYASWKWTVGVNTKEGQYPVEILYDDETVLKTTLNVTSKN